MRENQKKRIAVFGGAFDPIHNDHILLAHECLNFDYCDEVWFTPSPSRWDKTRITSAEHRLSMLSLAINDIPAFEICTLELDYPEYRGSYFFLSQLSKKYPDYEIILVVGSDSYPNMLTWRDPCEFNGTNFNGEALLREYSLIVCPRYGFPMPSIQKHHEKGYKGLFTFQEGQFQVSIGNISSTELRKRINTNRAAGLSPNKVIEYIKKNNLY
jgi:nicotinate-nucleotide adenylyltransferase